MTTVVREFFLCDDSVGYVEIKSLHNDGFKIPLLKRFSQSNVTLLLQKLQISKTRKI